MFFKFISLGLAGAIGTLARYWLSGLVQRSIGTFFPWGTAIVNILGCLLFGLLWSFSERNNIFSGEMRIIIFVGFFGAFTTFSTFMFECDQLIIEAQWLSAAENILLQNLLGLACMFVGIRLGQIIQ